MRDGRVFFRVLFNDAFERAAHHHAIGDGADRTHLFRGRDTETDRERKFSDAAHGCDQRLDAVRYVGALARYAGARNQVDESSGIFGDQFEPAFAAGWRGEEYGIETGIAHDLYVGLGLFDAQVREQTAVDPACDGVAR